MHTSGGKRFIYSTVSGCGLRTIVPAAVLALAALANSSAMAAESGGLAYLPGSAGDFVAGFPPIAGLFLANQTSFTDVTALNGNGGKTLAGSDLKASAFSNTSRILYSWPQEYGGFHFYNQIVVPIVTGSSTFKYFGNTVSSGSATGFGNIVFSPLIADYHFDAVNSAVIGYDYVSRLGTYSPTAAFNPATGYASHQPVLGFTHSPDQGLYFGGVARGIFNEKNPSTGYLSGNALEADFKAGWNFGKFKAGVVGGYYAQLNADSGPGQLNGKTSVFNFGPSVTYDFGPFSVNANVQTSLYAANTSKSTSVWVNLAIPLWVPPPRQN